MSTENNLFPTTEQEAGRAADELAEIKGHLKDFLVKLNQIEKRLHALAPTSKPKPVAKKDKMAQPEFSAGHLSAVYEGLLAKYKSNDNTVLADLQAMGKEQLFELAKHLGCKTTKSAKKDALAQLITGRLRESKLLTTGID